MDEVYAPITGITYMVSYAEFPGVEEYDLSKAQEVMTALEAIVRREIPHIKDVDIFCDHPEYVTRRDCDVDGPDLSDQDWEQAQSALYEDMTYKWLPEAFETAGVVFDDEDVETDFTDPNVVFDAIVSDLSRIIEDVENHERGDIVSQLESVQRAVLSLQESLGEYTEDDYDAMYEAGEIAER